MSDALDCAPYAISSTYPKGKVFSNHTHVALSSSLTIFTLFLVLILQTVQGCLSLILKARSFNIKLCQWMLP